MPARRLPRVRRNGQEAGRLLLPPHDLLPLPEVFPDVVVWRWSMSDPEQARREEAERYENQYLPKERRR